MTSKTKGAEPGFAAAMAELDHILDEIERDEVDVDVLAARVARASDLIAICRDRIAGARVAVERVVVDLSESPHEQVDEPASDATEQADPGGA